MLSLCLKRHWLEAYATGLEAEDIVQRSSRPGDARDAFLATIDLVREVFHIQGPSQSARSLREDHETDSGDRSPSIRFHP